MSLQILRVVLAQVWLNLGIQQHQESLYTAQSSLCWV